MVCNALYFYDYTNKYTRCRQKVSCRLSKVRRVSSEHERPLHLQRFAKWVAKEILLFHGLIFLTCLSFFVKVCEVTRLTRDGRRLERRERQVQIERSQ